MAHGPTLHSTYQSGARVHTGGRAGLNYKQRGWCCVNIPTTLRHHINTNNSNDDDYPGCFDVTDISHSAVSRLGTISFSIILAGIGKGLKKLVETNIFCMLTSNTETHTTQETFNPFWPSCCPPDFKCSVAGLGEWAFLTSWPPPPPPAGGWVTAECHHMATSPQSTQASCRPVYKLTL